jgi:putative chitinase
MSYTIGPRSLRFVCPWLSKQRASELAPALGQAFYRHHITTPRRAAMAVAQMAHESAGFRTATEYASGAEYEGRRDLGNIHPGDGKRFKGRGFIQITGRTNYSAVSIALGHDFLIYPEKLAHDHWAAMASCWWWEAHGCNQLADRGDFTGLTRRINGGLNGLASRRAYYLRARAVGRFLTPRKRGS